MEDLELEQETNDSFLQGWDDSTPEAEGADELPEQGGEAEAAPSEEDRGSGIASIDHFAPPGEIEMRNDILEFARCFPEAAGDPAAIPASVWAEVGRGRSLTVAYGQWALGRERGRRSALEEENAGFRRTRWNAGRSTGSMRTCGSSRRRDAFLEGWEED